MTRLLYNLLLHLALPLITARLWWRGRREPGYRLEWAERFGIYRDARVSAAATVPTAARASSAAPLIWVHAVSLGETRAAQSLIEALIARYPGHRLLVTHMTATGRDAAQSLYGGKADLAWLPYDLPWAVARFFDHYRPALGVLMETEVWPNLTLAAQQRGIPLLLANARMSEKSRAGYQRFGALTRASFAALHVAAQSDADATRLTVLGASAVRITGNLKFDLVAPAGQAEATLSPLFGAGKVFLAASTREGEEALLLDALARTPLDAVTVIVPRHPQRFDAVAALLEARAIPFTRRSENRPLAVGCRFVLGDSMGEMPAYYAACDCAFIGGSLLPLGGQNLIEACAVGTPVLTGPHTFNFADAAEQAVEAGAAIRVADADALVRAAAALLEDAARRDRMGVAARAFRAQHRGATARTMEVIETLLPAPR